jgi:hypothetical protein
LAGTRFRALHTRKLLLLALVCGSIATAAAFSLDRYLVATRRAEIAAQLPVPDRASLPAPAVERWRPRLFVAGEPAPPLDLVDVDTGARVSLAAHRGRRPVVLVMGSFGCNVFSAQVDEVVELYDKFGDRAAFYIVAISDAGHPLPEMALPDAARVLLAANDRDQRVAYARKGRELYEIPFPCLLDEYGEAERAYDAFPQRLLIIGIDGNIAFDAGWGADGGPSAWDFEKMERTLSLLQSSRDE